MSPELPASALYSHPSLARLWKKVHLACSPFIHRPAIRKLYSQPAPLLRSLLKRQPYHVIALGCAEGLKESLLLRKLPQPSHLTTADTSLTMARIAARKLPAKKKTAKKLDLTSPSSLSHVLQSHSNLPPPTRLLTLFGVLPNLDPLPLLCHLAKALRPFDLLLFSTNLAPGKNPRAGALRILPQYENLPTRRWLEAAARRYRPRLPQGQLVFQINSEPRQRSLARIEAHWISSRSTKIVFSSRRPTAPQVESWIQASGLRRLKRWIDPRGEEGGLACHPQGVTLSAFLVNFIFMGHSLRTKIMTGVIALLLLFAVALAITLYMVKDSDDEVSGILEYHMPILTRINSLDVITYEIEVIAHRLMDEKNLSQNRIEEIHARSQKCRQEIASIFEETKGLSEAGSKDARNDLEDRLAMARMVGEIDSLKLEVDRFSKAATLPVELMTQGKSAEARKAIENLENYEYLDPIITSARKKANQLAMDSLQETRANIFSIIWTNAVLFLSASLLGLFVFLLITGRLQTAFRRLTSAFHDTAEGKYSDPLPITSGDEIGDLTSSFNTMVDQLKSKEKLREAFGQFLDPRIVANVVNPATGELRHSADRRKVTIFFSDIAGFSGIGEQLTADNIVGLLNHYFTAATTCIRQHHGIVDKFIGDAVMAFWANPFSEGETHALDACLACLEMRPAFARIEQQISQITGLRRNIPKFHVRMALATGDTLIGTIGSDTTKSFTVIGDTVNIASRLEGVNKVYGTDLIINEDCYRLAERDVEAREIDFVTVYGKTEPVRIYELLSKIGELDSTTLQLRDAYAIALQLYREQKWTEAEKAFQNCLKISKNDGPSLEFLTRIATFARTPPPKDWNGVWQTASK